MKIWFHTGVQKIVVENLQPTAELDLVGGWMRVQPGLRDCLACKDCLKNYRAIFFPISQSLGKCRVNKPNVALVTLNEGQERLMPQNWKFSFFTAEP